MSVKDDDSLKLSGTSLGKFQFLESTPEVEEKPEKKDKEMETFRKKILKLRRESSALHEDLVALKKDKMEFYENFSRENYDILDKMMDEISRAEADIVSLEKDMLDEEGSDTSLPKETPPRPIQLKETEKALRICSMEIFRRQQDYARNALDSLKTTIEDLRDELFGFHECISSPAGGSDDEEEEDSSTDIQRSSSELRREEKRKEYERLLRELGMKPRSTVGY